MAELGRISATAAAPGVRVTVNLEGRLTDLVLEPQVLTDAAVLSATIYRLVQEASAAALNEGITALAAHVPSDLTDELRALVLPVPRPEPDSEPETWAVPH